MAKTEVRNIEEFILHKQYAQIKAIMPSHPEDIANFINDLEGRVIRHIKPQN